MDVGTLLSVSEAADELGVNRQKVLAFIDGGRLPAVRLGDGWWVSVSDLTRFAQVERRPGRPLSAARAWRLYATLKQAAGFVWSVVGSKLTGFNSFTPCVGAPSCIGCTCSIDLSAN